MPERLKEKLSQRRKPIAQPPKESDAEEAQRIEREKAARAVSDKHASEMVDQEEREKKRLDEREAKAKQAAALNTERAREAAEKMRQERAEAKAAEKPTRATIRRTKKAPTENDEDPPEEDQTPWQIFSYLPPPRAKAEFTYTGHVITTKMTAIEPQIVVNSRATVQGRGTNTKPVDAVAFLQAKPTFAGAKHGIRDLRSTLNKV